MEQHYTLMSLLRLECILCPESYYPQSGCLLDLRGSLYAPFETILKQTHYRMRHLLVFLATDSTLNLVFLLHRAYY